MKGIRGFGFWLPTLIALCLLARTAQAGVGESAVTNGATVQFAGIANNTNQIHINNGGAYIWDDVLGQVLDEDIVGATLVTVGANPPNQTAIFTTENPTNGGQKAGFTVYYVYFAGYRFARNQPLSFTFVISTIAPAAQGCPSAGLSFNAGGQIQNDTDAVFLGSYVTDQRANIVPFARHGDEVILEPYPPQYWFTTQPITFDSNPHNFYPFVQPSQSFPNAIPKTAAAMIADVTISSSVPNPTDLFVVDPILNTAAAPCLLSSQLDVSVPANGSTTIHHARLKSVNTVVDIAACTRPGNNQSYQALVSYVGWVEPIHHLF